MVWFDEIHINQEGGPRMFDDYQIRFTCDVNGRYSSSSTKIATEEFRTAYKYAGEARFCFGCAKVKVLNDQVIG